MVSKTSDSEKLSERIAAASPQINSLAEELQASEKQTQQSSSPLAGAETEIVSPLKRQDPRWSDVWSNVVEDEDQV